MIYILTGIAKSGKSIISKTIMERYPIQVISTDQIMMMIHYGSPEFKLDVNASDDTVSRKLEPFIRGLIKSLVSASKDALIEGVHFRAEFVKSLMASYPGKIRAVYLGYRNIDSQRKADELNRHRHLTDNCWYGHMSEAELLSLASYMIKESQRIYQECMTHHQTYVEIDDIMRQKEEIVSLLLHDDMKRRDVK